MLKTSKISTIMAGLLSGAMGAIIMVIIMASSPKSFASLMPANGLLPKPLSGTSSGVSEKAVPTNATEESQVISTVKVANPAVVSIIITKDVPVIERYFEDQQPSSPFDQFFGNGLSPFQFQVPQYRQNGTEKREVGGGSGFIVSSDGLVLTNKHVVADEEADYTVFTNDGQKHTAKVIARDPATDLAVIKIDGNNYSTLSFADSDKIQVGQSAIAIGNALGEFRNTVSVGVVSGLSRSITAGDGAGQSELLEGVIQTDAAINPGNSGGPLLNLQAQVIGVNVAVVSGSENIGFALPANIAKSVVDSVRKTGKISRPYIGVRYVTINDQLMKEKNLSVNYGALVVRGSNNTELAIIPGGPADKAGIRENDIILEVDGQKLDNANVLSNIIRKKKVGDKVAIKLLHNDLEKTITLTLQEATQ